MMINLFEVVRSLGRFKNASKIIEKMKERYENVELKIVLREKRIDTRYTFATMLNGKIITAEVIPFLNSLKPSPLPDLLYTATFYMQDFDKEEFFQKVFESSDRMGYFSDLVELSFLAFLPVSECDQETKVALKEFYSEMSKFYGAGYNYYNSREFSKTINSRTRVEHLSDIISGVMEGMAKCHRAQDNLGLG